MSALIGLVIKVKRLKPFDLETGMPVVSEVGNLSSKFGHTRPLGSRIICYVREGRTDRDRHRQMDGRTDGQKQRLLPYSLRAGAYREHINI